jgi:hypothetical protein
LHALKRLFCFPVAQACLLAVLTVLTVRGRFDDPDLWWHLKMGQVIYSTHSIPAHDLFSYTTNHQALVPQEWLAELSLYCAYLAGGYSGIMAWFCVFAVLLVVSGYALCWLYSGNVKVAFGGGALVWFFATIGFTIRPQLVAYCLLIAELILIELGRRRDARWFYALPAVFLVWINCHGSFVLGIVVGCALLACSFAEFEAGSLIARRWEPQRQRALAWALAASVAILPVNPAGVKQILYPFDTLMNMPLLMTYVQEWAPLKMTEARGIGLMAVLFCCCLLAITRKADLRLDELMLLGLGTWLAVSHNRMLIVFGILAAPILTRQLAGLWENYEFAKDRVLPNAIVIGGAVVAIILAFPSAANLEAQVEEQSPVHAVEYIQSHHLAGPMLNDYPSGGYLIWAAPEYPVMMDGRTDIYEWSGFLAEYGNWALGATDPNLLLDKYKVNFCLLSPHSQMVVTLSLLHTWKQVYADDHAVIFVRESGNRDQGIGNSF